MIEQDCWRGMQDGFHGFPKDFFAFFCELKANNERAWFEANKPRFQKSVQVPMSEFIMAMAPYLARVSRQFIADLRPNGGSMFRIYRDVRFARDKRPYKEHAACHFRHRLGRDVHAPGFYVHIAPDEVFYGAGLWMPEADILLRIRERIATKPKLWGKIVADKNFIRAFGGIEGEQLSRPPRGFDQAHPFIEDIKRKSFVAGANSTIKTAQSAAFVEEVAAGLELVAPLIRFLCSAVDVPF
jgi:uncharacterized protein (TIGR02453 family)